MSQYLGDFQKGSTVSHLWIMKDINGAMAQRKVRGSIVVYKHDPGSQKFEQAQSIFHVKDQDLEGGIFSFSISLSDEWYEEGKDYHVVLIGAVVDGQKINQPLAQFSIENRAAASNKDVMEMCAVALTQIGLDNLLNKEYTVLHDVIKNDTIIGHIVNSIAALRETVKASTESLAKVEGKLPSKAYLTGTSKKTGNLEDREIDLIKAQVSDVLRETGIDKFKDLVQKLEKANTMEELASYNKNSNELKFNVEILKHLFK